METTAGAPLPPYPRVLRVVGSASALVGRPRGYPLRNEPSPPVALSFLGGSVALSAVRPWAIPRAKPSGTPTAAWPLSPLLLRCAAVAAHTIGRGRLASSGWGKPQPCGSSAAASDRRLGAPVVIVPTFNQTSVVMINTHRH